MLPSVGDRVSVSFGRGRTVVATVSALFAKSESSPGGVRLTSDSGCGYSFHPLRWMDMVMGGKVKVSG